MGGDFGPSVTVPASLAFLSSHSDAGILLTGLPASLSAHPRFAQ